MLPLLLSLPLLLPPTALAAPEPDPAPAPAVEQLEFQTLVEALIEADNKTNRKPAETIDELSAALDALEAQASELAADSQALELRTYARLNLARAYQLTDQPELAAQTMDEAIRVANGDELPASEFGPVLDELYRERLEALEALGRATLEVLCDTKCRVLIDERELAPGSHLLLLGSYRVTVEARDGKHKPMVKVVELTEADVEFPVRYQTRDPNPPKPPEPPPPPKRILSRGGSVTMILIGAATAAVGVGVIGYVGGTRPPGTGESSGAIGAGIATLVVGGALLTTGVVSLSIDEVRLGKARGRQAMLSWTTHF